MTEQVVPLSSTVGNGERRGVAPSELYANERSDTLPFRVVIVTPPRVPAWLLDFAGTALKCGWIELVVVPVTDAKPPLLSRPSADVRAYLAVERVRHRHARDRGPLSLVAIDGLDGPVREAQSCAGQDADRLRDHVGAMSPDVILLAGPSSWSGPFAGQARWGCWNFDGSLMDPDYGGLPLLAPILKGESATLVGLELDCPDHGAVAMATSWGATHSSFHLQREQAFSKIPALLMRALRKLASSSLSIPPRRASVLRLVSTPASNRLGAGARATAIALRDAARWQLKKRRHGESWTLLLRQGEPPIDPASPDLGRNSVLAAPREDYWADPCVVEADGRRLIFVEEYGARRATGVIACLELLEDGSARRLGIAIDEPFHLSYPQAFLWEGQWYMTVESSAARRVSLYRATAFPMRWEREADLISGCVCVDGTLHHEDGHWYLFVNIGESGGSSCDELFLFVSEQLAGPYRAHPANPVVADVRRARPAGRLFRRDGRLIRPSQDCGPDYGAAIVFNEVVELSPTRYVERPLARLSPDHEMGMSGCHTYSATDTVEVLDAHGRLSDGMDRVATTDAPAELHTPPGSAPLLSVILLARGNERSVVSAIDSVLGQSCSDLELILVSDSSHDAVGAASDRYASRYPDRVRVIRRDAEGVRLSPLDGLAVARGRYFAVLGANETWRPDHVFACVTQLERDSGLGGVYASAEWGSLDPDSSLGNDELHQPALNRGGPRARSEFAANLSSGSAIVRRSVAHSCGAIEDLGGLFDAPGETMKSLLSRLSSVSDVACIGEIAASASSSARGDEFADDSAPIPYAPSLPIEETAGSGLGRALAGIDGVMTDDAATSRSPLVERPMLLADSLASRCGDAARGIAAIFRQVWGLPRSEPALATHGKADRDGAATKRSRRRGHVADPTVAGKVPVVGIGIHYLRYSTANLLVLAAGFISFPVLTRLLDNAQYGILGYYEAWVAVAVAVAKLGTQHSLVRFYPFQGTPEKLEHFATNLVALPIAISLSLWVLVAFALGVYSVASGSGFSPVFWCAFFSIPLLVLASVIEMVMRASERSLLLTVTRVAKRWLELLLVLGAVILLQHTALAVYWGRLAAAALILGYCIYWARRNLSFSMKALDVPAMFDSWRYGLPLVANEIAFIVLISIDRVMLKQITGDFAAVGIYTVGYSLAMQINVLMQASLYEAFVPVANRIHDVEGDGGVRALKSRILMPMTYASIGIAALIFGVGNEAMVALSGPTKIASGPVFVAIGMTFALYPLVDIAGYGLLLHKKSMLVLATTLAAAILNIVLNLLLIPGYGVMGAVVATTGSYILLGAIKCALCPPKLRGFPDLRTVMLACGCAAAFLVVIEFGNVLGVVSTWPRLFLAGLLFLALYALPVWLLDPNLRGLVASRREPRFA